jgi:FAD/FMN-containing dehydrogenase
MFQSSWFSVGPRVRRRGRRLVIRSGRATRIASLGLSDRTVVVDPDRRDITIRVRRFWFGRRADRIPFDLIAAVTFHFLASPNHDATVFAADRVEAYAVGLRLHGASDPDVHLFWFVGEGRVTNTGPFPDWVYWYQAVSDVCGTHEEEAQQFITALSRVVNKPIVRR